MTFFFLSKIILLCKNNGASVILFFILKGKTLVEEHFLFDFQQDLCCEN